MILRRLPDEPALDTRLVTSRSEGAAVGPRSGSRFSLRRMTLRTRLAVLTAFVVIVSIVITTLAAFTSVNQVLYQEIDKNLQTQAQNVIDSGVTFPREQSYEGDTYVPRFQDTSNTMRVLVVPPEQTGRHAKPSVFESTLGAPEMSVLKGVAPFAFSTVGESRIYAVQAQDGRVIVLAQDITFTEQTLDSLRLVLILVGVTGALGAIVAGIAVASTGVQPINRLRRAADRVSATGELRQIPVYSNDELGALTTSFNNMMGALQVSQEKQKDLVADAGHELKTPLTSLRTNVELLMLASRTDGATISEQDREDLERDVIGQIDEMSTLIGDLVDLAREDSTVELVEHVDLEAIFEDSLERVRRRRPDVTFDVNPIPWELDGDPFGLNRAIRNLLDNAAKWSPEGGVVRVFMEPVADSPKTSKDDRGARADIPTAVEIRIADSGPGIPEEDRAKVFERFYRSIQSRSMPGSGLGLAIVKQVITRHNGVIIADESDDGGALMRVVLPGRPGNSLKEN